MNSKAESAMKGKGKAKMEEMSVIDLRVGNNNKVWTSVYSESLATEVDGRMETG